MATETNGTRISPPVKHSSGIMTGAAFLMAVSAIGPGFLTQTTQFTAKLGASLAFAIVLSTVIDIGAQLNTWRVVCVSGRRGNEVANALIPGLGPVVSVVILLGSFVFNIGNLNGCALGLEALWDIPFWVGAGLSTVLALILFSLPRMLVAIDWFSKVLGAGMILMTFYVVILTAPPLVEAVRQAFWPDQIDVAAIVTMVGGTIGGYIMFSGAHRLLDAGVTGPDHLGRISMASIQGIVIAGIMRGVLFLAILGVVAGGATLSSERPVFDAFRIGAGQFGFVLSALIFWSAAITSVVGCSYTAISFLGGNITEHRRAWMIGGFILLSLAATIVLRLMGWQATGLLIAAGTLNGILMPVVLGVVLAAAYRPGLVGSYRHPWWASALGILAWLVTVYLAYKTVVGIFASVRA